MGVHVRRSVPGLPAWMAPLSVRAGNVLHAHFGGRWPEASEVAAITVADFLRNRGAGRMSLKEVGDALGDVGLSFAKPTADDGHQFFYLGSLTVKHRRRLRDAAPELRDSLEWALGVIESEWGGGSADFQKAQALLDRLKQEDE